MRCDRCKLFGKCRAIRKASREHFRWTVHNLIGHPLSEIAYLFGKRKLSDWLHESTIPAHDENQGRG